MALFLIKRDGATIGAIDESEQMAALSWFHHNVPAYSMDHATKHEGYSVDQVENIDCHDVEGILCAIAERAGLKMDATFIPYSQSRHATGETPWRSLNWHISLTGTSPRFAKLATDYAQGEGYAPASKKDWGRNSHLKRRAVDIEIETGFIATGSVIGGGEPRRSMRQVPKPSIGDVLQSLVRDADAIEYGTFELWADTFGYDPDSRAAEETYRACVKIGLELRACCGERLLSELSTVAAFN